MNDKEFALNAAMNRMRKKLNHLTGDIESWKEDMVNDYAEFFRWHADDLYEAMAAKAILEPVYETAKGLGLAALEESLRQHFENGWMWEGDKNTGVLELKDEKGDVVERIENALLTDIKTVQEKVEAMCCATM